MNRLLAMVADGSVMVVRVTDEDRLTRFGVGWRERLFAVYGVAVYGVSVEVAPPRRSGGRGEVLEDVGSVVTMFAGRRCGLGSARARRRLLAETGQCRQVDAG